MKVIVKFLLVLFVAAIGLTQAAEEAVWEKAEILLKSDDQITDSVSIHYHLFTYLVANFLSLLIRI